GLARVLRVLGDAVEIRVDGVAERGQGDERLALKKGAAQFALQPYDGVGQRGLGHAAAPGRSREIALLAQGQDIADLVHLHGSTSSNPSRSPGSLPSTSAFDGEVVHRAALFVAGGRMHLPRAFKSFASLRGVPG